MGITKQKNTDQYKFLLLIYPNLTSRPSIKLPKGGQGQDLSVLCMVVGNYRNQGRPVYVQVIFIPIIIMEITTREKRVVVCKLN